ncbi:MAG: hypothetical protein DSY70_03580 [Desulfobulbus sp.]|nr:MAG: hypothetical protein DSY70_03580 [Desulfobulbus sp.]
MSGAVVDKKCGQAEAGVDDERGRQPWQKPEILSVEPLEAAASICEPANAPFGKDFPGTCGTLGS